MKIGQETDDPETIILQKYFVKSHPQLKSP